MISETQKTCLPEPSSYYICVCLYCHLRYIMSLIQVKCFKSDQIIIVYKLKGLFRVMISYLCMCTQSVAQSCLTLCEPMDCSSSGSSVHGIRQTRMLEWFAMPSSRGTSPTQGSNPVSCLQADSLPSELPGKPKNTGEGSLSLLQGIFLTQELNQGLLNRRRILYQLSYQGSPEYVTASCVCHLFN